jgi:hypothetical protein
MQTWRKVWREGIAPQRSTRGLEALRSALIQDDERLTQGSTSTPPPLQCLKGCPAEGACVVGYCGWQGDGLETVGAIEEFFANVCQEADRRLGEPTACRWFLNWFDDRPRAEMRRRLLPEVAAVLAKRHGAEQEEAPSGAEAIAAA